MKKLLLAFGLICGLPLLVQATDVGIFNEPANTAASSGSTGTINTGTLGQAAYYSAATGISPFTGLLTSGTNINYIALNGNTVASDTQVLYQRCDPICHLDGGQGHRYFFANNDTQMDRLVISNTTAYITPTARLEVYTSGTTVGLSTTSIQNGSLTSGTLPMASNGGLVIDSGATWTPATAVFGVPGAVSATGALSAGNGTVTLPSITFGSDTDTGWFHAGSNQPSLAVAGAVVVRVAQSSVGVMTSGTAPSATLQVSTVCASGACPGTGMFAGQLSVNVGSQGGSITIPGGGLYSSGTAYIAGGISATSSIFFTNMGTGTAVSNVCTTSTGQIVSTTTLSGCLGVSDPALKKGIRALPYGLAEIMAIDPVMYRDIRTDQGAYAGEQIGLLAYSVDREGKRYRGVETLMPELVDPHGSTYNGKTYKGLIYERLGPVLINAIHELERQNEAQDAQIHELQSAVDQLLVLNGMMPLHSGFGARVRWLFMGQ